MRICKNNKIRQNGSIYIFKRRWNTSRKIAKPNTRKYKKSKIQQNTENLKKSIRYKTIELVSGSLDISHNKKEEEKIIEEQIKKAIKASEKPKEEKIEEKKEEPIEEKIEIEIKEEKKGNKKEVVEEPKEETKVEEPVAKKETKTSKRTAITKKKLIQTFQ